MALLLKLAFRNIFRNFRRSLLTFLAISIGIALGILFIGFQTGAEMQSIKLSTDTWTGHVKVHEKGYIDEELTLSLDYTLEDFRELHEGLQEIPGYVSSAERILFPVSVTDGIDELRLTGIGINIEREDRIFDIKSKLLDGAFIKPGEEKTLLTDTIAELFSLTTGDFITIIARTKYGALNAIDLEIAGIIHIGNAEVDTQCLFIPIDVAQFLLEMENMATEIIVMCESMNVAEDYVSRVKQTLDASSLDIVTWQYMIRDLIRMYELRKKARGIIIAILLLMASFSVMNTMLMSIFERTKEIGTVMALGMRRSKVRLLFLFEGLFLGVFGSIIGCLLGGSATYYFAVYGINVEAFGSDVFGNFPIGAYIYTDFSMVYIAGAFILGVVVATLSAAYPAIKGSNMQPVDALRYV